MSTPVEPEEIPEAPFREVGYTENHSSFQIQYQSSDGEAEPWSFSGHAPQPLEIRLGPDSCSEDTWRAYVDYLNTWGAGNYRLVRLVSFSRTEVL
jgi:hypothetical protein